MSRGRSVLDLFSGIGGFSLGLERAGFRTVAFCEIEPYCRAVLRKHWPDVPCYDDVRAVTAERLAADGIAVDLICGGFPCQDISLAGKGAGLDGERSGLWFEYRRIIEEVRPAWVVIENVSALRSRGLDVVLGSLAALGYDAEWHCVSAAAVGAPHIRDRVWVLAYPQRQQLRQQSGRGRGADGAGAPLAAEHGAARALADAHRQPPIWSAIARTQRDPWSAEPSVGRVVDGLPYELASPGLRALGNAVVPQIPEIIGRAILAAEESDAA